jgi:hypothetical protein
MQIQLAWKFIEFLEALSDLILEHYIDESSEADPMEDSNSDDPWSE